MRLDPGISGGHCELDAVMADSLDTETRAPSFQNIIDSLAEGMSAYLRNQDHSRHLPILDEYWCSHRQPPGA